MTVWSERGHHPNFFPALILAASGREVSYGPDTMVTMTEPIYRLRSSGQYVKFVLALVFIALFMLSLYLDPNTHGFFPPILIGAGLTLIAYVFFIMPSLLLDRDGVTIHNWFVDRWLSWRDFVEIDSRFGLHIISTDASDPVSAYPGSGGLTRGRERMSSSPLAKDEPKPAYIPIHESGQHNQQAALRDATSLIVRMAEEFGTAAPHRSRTRMLNPMRIALVIIGIALAVLGVQAII